MDGDAGRKITQWLGAGPSALQSLAQLLEEHQQLQKQADAATQECAKLRQQLATVHAENRQLVDAWSEMDEALTEGLGQANDAVLRFRAALTAPVASAPPPAPVTAPEVVAPASVAPTKPPEPDPIATPPAASPAVAAGPPPATEPEPPSVPQILVVDDDPHFRTMMVDYLTEKRGYEVHAATSGTEAMAALASIRPHAVLLDLAMPGGGLWAVERIKASHPDLCVIVVSANDDVSLVAKTRALGAADYVSKPFDLEYLGAVLDNHLNGNYAGPVSILAELAASMNGGVVVPAR